MNRSVYPYDGEAIRFRECIDGLIQIGGQIAVSESGELEVTSREPVPPALVAELRYFKRSLLDFYGPNRLPSNLKRERFCQEFLVDLNATKAAIRAGYSKATARQTGHRLLTKVDIQDRIAELQNDRSERLQITQDRVLQELAAIAFSSLGDVLEWTGKTFRVKEGIGPDALRGIELISNGRYGPRIKTHNKLEALFLLGKHLGMFGGETRTTSERVPLSSPAPVLMLGDNTETEREREEPTMPGKPIQSFLRIEKGEHELILNERQSGEGTYPFPDWSTNNLSNRQCS